MQSVRSSENVSCARKLPDRKPSLFNAFEIFDHTRYPGPIAEVTKPNFASATIKNRRARVIALPGLSGQSATRYWSLYDDAFSTCTGGIWSDFRVWTETILKVPLPSLT
jgi:hypothetical protein